MSLFGSKKAQAENYIAVAIFLLIFGFISVLATFMWIQFIAGFEDAGYYEGQMEETGNKFLATLKLYDTIIVFMMIVLLIGVGLTSYRLRTSPAFFNHFDNCGNNRIRKFLLQLYIHRIDRGCVICCNISILS